MRLYIQAAGQDRRAVLPERAAFEMLPRIQIRGEEYTLWDCKGRDGTFHERAPQGMPDRNGRGRTHRNRDRGGVVKQKHGGQ